MKDRKNTLSKKVAEKLKKCSDMSLEQILTMILSIESEHIRTNILRESKKQFHEDSTSECPKLNPLQHAQLLKDDIKFLESQTQMLKEKSRLLKSENKKLQNKLSLISDTSQIQQPSLSPLYSYSIKSRFDDDPSFSSK